VASRSVTQLSTKRLGNYTVIGLESRGVSKIDVYVPLWQVLASGLFGGVSDTDLRVATLIQVIQRMEQKW
jgi:hypothetical protein